MSKCIFISAYAGKTKDKQRPFNKVSIALLNAEGCRIYDLFTDGGALLANQDQLRFGDIVKPSYKESEIPGGRQSLIGLEVISPSPYSLT